jgi:hypothetical protein
MRDGKEIAPTSVNPDIKKAETKQVAAVEPASGKTVETVKEKPASILVPKKEAKPEKKEKTVIKKPEVDIVWSIKRPTTAAKQAQIASGPYPIRTGVARPILE